MTVSILNHQQLSHHEPSLTLKAFVEKSFPTAGHPNEQGPGQSYGEEDGHQTGPESCREPSRKTPRRHDMLIHYKKDVQMIYIYIYKYMYFDIHKKS